jgi:hypothetical protein
MMSYDFMWFHMGGLWHCFANSTSCHTSCCTKIMLPWAYGKSIEWHLDMAMIIRLTGPNWKCLSLGNLGGCTSTKQTWVCPRIASYSNIVNYQNVIIFGVYRSRYYSLARWTCGSIAHLRVAGSYLAPALAKLIGFLFDQCRWCFR